MPVRTGTPSVGPRLERLFEAQCDRLGAAGQQDRVAVHAPDTALTYHELDFLANQLARHLLAQGARRGDRIGLFLEQGHNCFIAMLAVLKIHAGYVPLDPAFPADRISYIIAHAGVGVLVSDTALARRSLVAIRPGGRELLIDMAAPEVDDYDGARLELPGPGGPDADLAGLIYPSGPSGRPDGVEVTHTAMFQFALTAARIYGINSDDRVYEGLSAGPGFSAEGIWVAWTVGAALVPNPAGESLWGHDLRRFLVANQVTSLYCDPAQLVSVGEELSQLRVIAVSGQACPSDLLARWHRPGRRVVSVYGTTRPDQPTAAVPVVATSDLVQASGGGVTVHLTPGGYQETSDDHLRRLLID